MGYDDKAECTESYRERLESALLRGSISPHPQAIDPADAAVDIAVQGIMANSVKIVKMAQKDKWARELIRTMVQSDLW